MNYPIKLPVIHIGVERFLKNILSIILISTFLLSACRPATAPEPKKTSPATKKPETILATPTLTGLKVKDDGSPLPIDVIATEPGNNQPLSTHGNIRLIFNQPMDVEKTNAAFSVQDAQGKKITGDISWPDPGTMEFLPSQPLAPGSTYVATLGEEAASSLGKTLLEAQKYTFETSSPLQVSQVFPNDQSKDIAVNAVITAIFNRPVVPLVISEEKANLVNPLSISPDLPGEGEWISTSVYAFQPTQALQTDTTYRVSVKAGLEDAVHDSKLTEDFSWGFSTTKAGIKSLMLSNGRENPQDSLNNILLNESFTINFLQPMQPKSTEAAISLVNSKNEKTTLEAAWNKDSTQVKLTPTDLLAIDTQYTLEVSENAKTTGGANLSKGLKWTFFTVPYPEAVEIQPNNQTSQQYFSSELRIRFSTPMNIESVKERIVINPKPAETVTWWYNEWDWSIYAYSLKPSTHYEVKLLPGMQDIYGNTTTVTQTFRFETAAYEPSVYLEMPYQSPIIRQNGPQEFYIAYRNIRSAQVKVYRVTDEQFMGAQTGALSMYNFQPEPDDLVWEHEITARGKLNELVLDKLTPKVKNQSKLENGFYFMALRSPDIEVTSLYNDYRMFIVASASLNFKTSGSDGLVWLTDLESGKPIPEIPVTVYNQDFKNIGEGVTDKDGLVRLEFPPSNEYYSNRFALARDKTSSFGDPVFAFTSTDWGSGANVYDYGIWGAYFSPANQPKAYVYTERPIYRPGQPVFFKGIVRIDDDLNYQIADLKKVRITIENFKDIVLDQEFELNEMGSFAGKLTLDEDASLGYYTLSVFPPEGADAIGSVTFNVAEYRRPEFQVKVNSDKDNVLNGDTFSIAVQAEYYSGGGVSDAQVNWSLTKEPFQFTPPSDYSAFSFVDYEENEDLYQNGGSASEVVAEGQGTTDSLGFFRITQPASLGASGTSQQFTLEASITDIAQNLVSGRTTITAHQSQVYPGIRSTTYIGTINKPLTLEIVALDWAGKPVPGQIVSVDVVERRWYSVQEQDAEGRVTWKSSVEEIPVQSFENLVANQQGLVKTDFTPPKGGVYRARVKSQDAHNNLGAASTYVWVAGDEFIPWRQTNDRSFDLVTNKAAYRPGENAEILIASPFQGDAYALVTVERGRLHYQEVIKLTSNSTLYKLPISADMAPNAYVSVLIIKGIDENNPRPNFRMGIKEIKVDASQVVLSVNISAEPAQAGPGDTVLYNIRTSDYNGKPVSAEVSLGLSDLATLSLMDPNSAPIDNYFYSERSLGVWTSAPITLDIEDYNQNIRDEIAEGPGMGSGGGEKGFGELGVIDVRQDFPDTAFWEAFVTTGEDGQANISITLPDNLTTWRMEAKAVTADTLVGQAEYDLVSSKPLLIRPQTPRFLIAGDKVRFGASIQNNTNQTLDTIVTLEAEGVQLAGNAKQELEIKANSQVFVTWDAVVQPGVKRVDLIFQAQSGEFQDATRPTLGTLDNQGIPVYAYAEPETVGTAGVLSSGESALEAIHLPQGWPVDQGYLDIRLSPSLAASMTDSLTYLKNYPYDCLEQTISRFLPNVLSTQALKAAGINAPDLETDLKEQVSVAMQQISSRQNANGGWGWWGAEKSDLLTSAYVVLGLVEARDAGYEVSSKAISLGVNYLQTQIVSSVSLVEREKINQQAFLLYVLNRAGKPDVSSSVQLYKHRQNADLYARALLAQTLFSIDAEDTRVDTLLSDLNSAAILSASGTHWEEAKQDRWNWNTDTRTTAIILSAISQIDPENPLNANAVRWLVSHRRNGHWSGTQETSWALMALIQWMASSGELKADYKYGVALNGKQLGGGEANANNLRDILELKVEIGQLTVDEANRLLIARDEGPGNLYYTAFLNVWLPVDQIKALDQGLVISRSYYRLDDLETPVKQAKHGELLLARLTLVAPNDAHYLVVDDPLPAGLEAVDQALKTSPQSINVPQEYSREDLFWKGWGWWYFDQFQYKDEKVVLAADYLPAGTYIYTYLVRAGTVGEFYTIPPTAQEFYFPDVYGRGDGSIFTVTAAQ